MACRGHEPRRPHFPPQERIGDPRRPPPVARRGRGSGARHAGGGAAEADAGRAVADGGRSGRVAVRRPAGLAAPVQPAARRDAADPALPLSRRPDRHLVHPLASCRRDADGRERLHRHAGAQGRSGPAVRAPRPDRRLPLCHGGGGVGGDGRSADLGGPHRCAPPAGDAAARHPRATTPPAVLRSRARRAAWSTRSSCR